ncbi:MULTISPECIES: ABC transporter permease [Chelativorans]|jgi:iron(III) transport system permease protein|nr:MULTISPECIES: iron ABC transporter permease [Chelativorans]
MDDPGKGVGAEMTATSVSADDASGMQRLKVKPKSGFGGAFATRIIWVAAVLLLLLLVVAPMLALLLVSLGAGSGDLGLGAYFEQLALPRVQRALYTTLLVSSGVAVLSVLVGVPLSFGVARTRMYGKKIVRVAILLTLFSPPFLIVMAYIALIGPTNGWINVLVRDLFQIDTSYGPFNVFSILGFLLLALPSGVAFVFIQTAPLLENMDPSLEEAARLNGARPGKMIMTITIPLMRHAILSGGLLAFTVTLTLYGTPYLLQMDYLTIEIRNALLVTGSFQASGALSIVLAIGSLFMLFLYRLSIRNVRLFQTIGGKSFRPAMLDLGWGRHLFTALGAVYALATCVIPYIAILLVSFMGARGLGLRWDNFSFRAYEFVFSSPIFLEAFGNSLILSFSAATSVVVLGVVVAYIVVRTRITGSGILDYIAILPLGIAGTSFAVGLIVTYLSPPLGYFPVYGTLSILLLAYVASNIPFGVRISQNALIQVGSELEEASRISGGSWMQTLMFVTVPLVKRGLLYAWIMVFVQCLPELSASIMLKGPGTEVVSTAMIAAWEGTGGVQAAAAMGIILLLVIGITMLVAMKVVGRSLLEASDD